MTPRPMRASQVRRRQAQADADRVVGYIRLAMLVLLVVCLSIVINSPGYEQAIESIGRL